MCICAVNPAEVRVDLMIALLSAGWDGASPPKIARAEIFPV